jgi:cytochrome c-type biogenesis protein CcmE
MHRRVLSSSLRLFSTQVPNYASRLRTKRITYFAVGTLAVGASALLLANAFEDSLMFYMTPSQALHADPPVLPTRKMRLGGMVAPGSVTHDRSSMSVCFDVSDYSDDIVRVSYSGMLPDLFREGQGVVAEGYLNATDKTFRATEVLAKHDENYMPKDIKAKVDELKAAKELQKAEAK